MQVRTLNDFCIFIFLFANSKKELQKLLDNSSVYSCIVTYGKKTLIQRKPK